MKYNPYLEVVAVAGGVGVMVNGVPSANGKATVMVTLEKEQAVAVALAQQLLEAADEPEGE